MALSGAVIADYTALGVGIFYGGKMLELIAFLERQWLHHMLVQLL